MSTSIELTFSPQDDVIGPVLDQNAPVRMPLKLFGSWASSYTQHVQLALRLKGLEFDYVEDDMGNKSDELLRHNPCTRRYPCSSTAAARSRTPLGCVWLGGIVPSQASQMQFLIVWLPVWLPSQA